MRQLALIAVTAAATASGWMLGARQGSTSHIGHSDSEGYTAETTATITQGAQDFVPVKSRAQQAFERIIAEFPEPRHCEERGARLYALLHDLKDDEFASVIADLGAHPDWWNREAAKLVAGYWAERDLSAARQWALSLDEKVARDFCEAVFETWARTDLTGMLTWTEQNASTLPSDAHRSGVTQTLVQTAWREDPERGIRLLKRLNLDGGGLYNLYREWAESRPEKAAERALLEPDDRIRNDIIKGIVVSWAPKDPDAARALAETIPDPLVSQQTATSIGSYLAFRDAKAGAEYLAHLPQTNDTRSALKGLVELWTERNPAVPLEWAAGLEDSKLGDWVANAVLNKVPEKRRTQADQVWRQLRADNPSGGQP